MARFVLTAVFVALFSLEAFAGPPSLVIVERHVGDIIITRGVGQTEKLEAPANLYPKNYQANAELLHTVFSKLYAEGYALQNSTSLDPSNGLSVTTYLFVKP